jgi:Glutaredoxin-related protein
MSQDQSTATGTDDTTTQVNRLIEQEPRVLFIKGTPDKPQCGFSQRAVGTLAEYGREFAIVNVLSALPEYRTALESHSGWETIPQLYVDGEFIGGSDIIVELAERGELEERLTVE